MYNSCDRIYDAYYLADDMLAGGGVGTATKFEARSERSDESSGPLWLLVVIVNMDIEIVIDVADISDFGDLVVFDLLVSLGILASTPLNLLVLPPI